MAVNYNPRSVTDGLALYTLPSNPRGYIANGAGIADMSGNYPSGVLTNMSAPSAYVRRAGGTSLNFNGANNSVSVNNFQKLSSFTVSTWAKREDSISHIFSINGPSQLVMTMGVVDTNLLAAYNFGNGNQKCHTHPSVTAGAFTPIPLTGAGLTTPQSPQYDQTWTQAYQLVSTAGFGWGNPVTVTLTSASQMTIQSVRFYLGRTVNNGNVRLSNNITAELPVWNPPPRTLGFFSYTFATPIVGTSIVFTFETQSTGGLFGPVIDNFCILGSVSGVPINGTKFQTSVWDASNNSISAESTIPLPSSNFEMLTVSYNGGASASTAFKMYINDTELSYTPSSSGTYASLNQNSANAYLAFGRDTLTSYHFRGQIDDARVYNRTLSQAEVLQNYSATRGRFGV
jgi:hypothetical protein